MEVEPSRHRYRIDTALWTPRETRTGRPVRRAASSDRDALAELMLDADRGTIDDEGETLDDALDEIDRFFARRPLTAHSWVGLDGERFVSACLVGEDDGIAFVEYVMTRRSFVGDGWARSLVDRVIGGLVEDGRRTVELVITDGNRRSERLFASATRLD